MQRKAVRIEEEEGKAVIGHSLGNTLLLEISLQGREFSWCHYVMLVATVHITQGYFSITGIIYRI